VWSDKVTKYQSIGDIVLIPRITDNLNLPFKFKRRQFPVSICSGMTINKSQGQTLSIVGLYLPRPVFSHGQLYVALSRVKIKQGPRILIENSVDLLPNTTINVVYK
jgi:ATP-dependent DNA helicase PIF1